MAGTEKKISKKSYLSFQDAYQEDLKVSTFLWKTEKNVSNKYFLVKQVESDYISIFKICIYFV